MEIILKANRCPTEMVNLYTTRNKSIKCITSNSSEIYLSCKLLLKSRFISNNHHQLQFFYFNSASVTHCHHPSLSCYISPLFIFNVLWIHFFILNIFWIQISFYHFVLFIWAVNNTLTSLIFLQTDQWPLNIALYQLPPSSFQYHLHHQPCHFSHFV